MWMKLLISSDSFGFNKLHYHHSIYSKGEIRTILTMKSKPANNPPILCKPTQPVQHIGRYCHKGKCIEHFNVGFKGDTFVLEVDVVTQFGEEISGQDETNKQWDHQKLKISG